MTDTSPDNLCPGCFADKGSTNPCPHCGYDEQASIAPHSHEEGDLFRYGLEQFLGEARTLARLDHPNIVRVRHFFEANGTAYLVMDY
ncbi:MAG: hypothetical protein LJE70_07235 [Chromatiaceae bacterium]|jgi:serine/threonine protein kinase|nr:hypothetical protein [Chromatiaceae bacterium]